MSFEHFRKKESPAKRRTAFVVALIILSVMVVVTVPGLLGGLSFGPLHTTIRLVSLAFAGWVAFVLWRRSR